MGLTITVSGTQRAYMRNTLNVEEALGRRNTGNVSFRVMGAAWAPTEGKPVVIADAVEGNLFGGTIDEVRTTYFAGGTVVQYDCRLVSYEAMCDRRYTGQGYTRAYVNQKAGDIIKDLNHLCLFGEGSASPSNSLDDTLVNDGPVISVEFDFATITEAFNTICNLSGITWVWDITPDKELRFYQQSAYPSPFTILDSHIPRDEQYSVTSTRQNYANHVHLRLGKFLMDPETELFAGDGSKRTFVLQHPIVTEPTILLDGAAQTVGVVDVDTGKDWYWQMDSSQIQQDAGGTVLAIGVALSVTYTGYEATVYDQEDIPAKAARTIQDGYSTSGIYEILLENNDPKNLQQAADIATAYLNRYKYASLILDLPINTIGIHPGQEATLGLTQSGITGKFLVESVTIRDGAGVPRFNCRLSSGATIGDWKDQLKNLVATGSAKGVSAISQSSGAPGGSTVNFTISATMTADTAVASPAGSLANGNLLFVHLTTDGAGAWQPLWSADFSVGSPATEPPAMPSVTGTVIVAHYIFKCVNLKWEVVSAPVYR